jgi:hypothetical protein
MAWAKVKPKTWTKLLCLEGTKNLIDQFAYIRTYTVAHLLLQELLNIACHVNGHQDTLTRLQCLSSISL